MKSKRTPWTMKDVSYVKKNYNEMKAKEIGKVIGRSLYSVMSMVRNLKLTKPRTYTEAENAFIKDNYRAMNYKEIAADLDRPLDSIRKQARKLGLRKNNKRNLQTTHTND